MRVAAWVVLGALAATALVALVLFARELRRSGWRVLRVRLARSRRIWRLAVRRVVRFLRIRRRAGEAEIEAFHLETAEQVFELMGGMKGAIMKLGQLISILGDALPGPYMEALKGLQQQAPPMTYELAAGVVEEELGRSPDVLFRRFSRRPVAAASIGQVHRAELDDGTRVAVKIQYPGVDVAIRADLDNAFLLWNVARVMAPGMEPGPLVDELKARMGDELDYHKEAANQEAFAVAYEGHPWIRVPRVIPEYSAGRVLTSEWVEGRSLYEMLEAPVEARDRIGEQLFRFWVGSVGRLRFFNADPHPGNYFFCDDGTIWFLDFGMVKRFDGQVAQNLVDQIVALRAGDREALRDAMLRHGWFKPTAPLDMERVYELALLTQKPLVESRPFTYTTEYVQQVIEAAMMLQGPYGDLIKHMTLPADHLMLNRIQLGVGSILGRLRATNVWAAVFDEYVLGAVPATPLGEEAAGWPRAPAPSEVAT